MRSTANAATIVTEKKSNEIITEAHQIFDRRDYQFTIWLQRCKSKWVNNFVIIEIRATSKWLQMSLRNGPQKKNEQQQQKKVENGVKQQIQSKQIIEIQDFFMWFVHFKLIKLYIVELRLHNGKMQFERVFLQSCAFKAISKSFSFEYVLAYWNIVLNYLESGHEDEQRIRVVCTLRFRATLNGALRVKKKVQTCA